MLLTVLLIMFVQSYIETKAGNEVVAKMGYIIMCRIAECLRLSVTYLVKNVYDYPFELDTHIDPQNCYLSLGHQLKHVFIIIGIVLYTCLIHTNIIYGIFTFASINRI